MAVENRNVHTAVVLQGGGALGAYEYGVLKALFLADDIKSEPHVR